MTVVTFAVPDESRPFARRLTNLHRSRHMGALVIQGELRSQEVVLVHVGMGAEACRTNLATLDHFKPTRLIAAGVAGALDPQITVGEVFFISNYSTLPQPGDISAAKMTTSELVANSIEEKNRLFRESGARLIDMETAILHAFAIERKIPLLSIRAVSDDANHDFPIPSDVLFDSTKQRPRVAALLYYLCTHPQKIAPFASFVGNVAKATNALADALDRLVSPSGS